MQQPRPVLYRIKNDKLHVWREWCSELQTNLAKGASKTIAEEGESFEFFIIFKVGEAYFTLGGAIISDDTKLHPADETNPLNQRHQQMKKECLEFVDEAEYGYLLEATKNT